MKDDYAMNKTAQITRQRRSAKELDFAVKKNSERRRRCGRALTEYNNISPIFFREPIRCRKLFQTIYTSEKFGDADDARAQLDSN